MNHIRNASPFKVAITCLILAVLVAADISLAGKLAIVGAIFTVVAVVRKLDEA